MTYSPRPKPSGDTLVGSRDQIRTNFEVIQDRFEDNHTAYGSGSGKHSFIQIPERAAIPAGLVASDGTLYTKDANGRSQLFYTDEDSGNEYQMTRANVGAFTEFATNTNYSGSINGGWTFLPGGMILNYGFLSAATTTTRTITFAKSLTNTSYSVTITPVGVSLNDTNVSVITGSISNTSFDVRNPNSLSIGIYWMAIGV